MSNLVWVHIVCTCKNIDKCWWKGSWPELVLFLAAELRLENVTGFFEENGVKRGIPIRYSTITHDRFFPIAFKSALQSAQSSSMTSNLKMEDLSDPLRSSSYLCSLYIIYICSHSVCIVFSFQRYICVCVCLLHVNISVIWLSSLMLLTLVYAIVRLHTCTMDHVWRIKNRKCLPTVLCAAKMLWSELRVHPPAQVCILRPARNTQSMHGSTCNCTPLSTNFKSI